ncbi:MAG: 30S ribosomal protein S8 [Verrucomicrobia bacterium CG_4_10_14_3_um_filter_43_23]|nr:MAG: 30S ribosomal protein S8 [Verrucomicrobia bacterium CG1_02_43_26]PIP59602.1 MAG: 30S ribosomal protein S8 [Verrucomicrobia bacterium CG22_combo_CG10-13_8_21_14_all_43_17]PIX58901.1 MAG: 30S ribosomal protein S8 [Verrucomicrobia bacterium CG_4_10_14_3_um_filter_43_23]PIY61677.1 MAG: 30S ribosomal protein S8 [Verrucomicrobia bacterium CG_4_10_14_0_8_um_filter_43_34]PJA44561.1 MAG: 30S ribosomal protein S8 [Verrucomicrobia bacterium CG_4_9_14_3_um_filter_43_20]
MDTVADFLTIIRNASNAGNKDCMAQWSKMRENIVTILKKEGYIKDFKVVTNERQLKFILVTLKYFKGRPAITGVKRQSSPGQRQYCGSTEIPYVLGGMGICILTTSKGVMKDKDARQNKVGGELLCKVW